MLSLKVVLSWTFHAFGKGVQRQRVACQRVGPRSSWGLWSLTLVDSETLQYFGKYCMNQMPEEFTDGIETWPVDRKKRICF